MTSSSPERRFRTVYADAYDDVLRFVQRRTDPGRAEDVVADTMVAAWRRVEDLPDELGDARAWLFGIARNCLLNETRSYRRRDALGVRIADARRVGGDSTLDDADAIAARVDLAAAWAALSTAEQEVIALSAFEGLTSAQAGAVLGITATAYRLRLSRARGALRRHLEGADSHPGLTDTAPYEEMRS